MVFIQRHLTRRSRPMLLDPTRRHLRTIRGATREQCRPRAPRDRSPVTGKWRPMPDLVPGRPKARSVYTARPGRTCPTGGHPPRIARLIPRPAPSPVWRPQRRIDAPFRWRPATSISSSPLRLPSLPRARQRECQSWVCSLHDTHTRRCWPASVSNGSPLSMVWSTSSGRGR